MSVVSDSQEHNLSLIDDEDVTEEWRNSDNEPPFGELSGDEAIEKSFASTLHSSMWKRGTKQNLFFAGIAIMKSMVGVGILGIPNVFRNFGVLISASILIFFAIGHSFTSYLLLKSKNICKHSNYSTIGYFIFQSRWIIVFVNITIILVTLGSCLGEIIIYGTTVENLVRLIKGDDQDIPFYLTKAFLTCLVGILMYPLLIVKSIEKLKFVSLIAILSIATFIILVIFNFFQKYQQSGVGEGFTLFIPQDFDFKSAFGSLPTVILAYNWQFNVFPIFKSLRKPSNANLMKSNALGTGLALILYMAIGVLGYATYGSNIETDFLKVIDVKVMGKTLYIFLNVTFTFSTTLTCPIIFFGARNNALMLVKQFRTSDKRNEITQIQDRSELSQEEKAIQFKNQKIKNKRKEDINFYIVTTFLLVLLIVFAITMASLETVFNFLGAVACNLVDILLPTFFYFILCEKVKKMKFENARKRFFYYFVKAYFVFGLVILVVCVTSEILKTIS